MRTPANRPQYPVLTPQSSLPSIQSPLNTADAAAYSATLPQYATSLHR